jgi:hypothetical protein
MGLGAVSRREARRLADELAVMARRRFDEAKWQMEVSEDSNVGSPEWIEGLKNHLIVGLARLQDPPPPRTPLDAASHNAIGHLVQIEQELRKGRAASPIMVTNADRLRRVYFDRLITLGRLGDALEQRSEDDALYSALAKLDRPAPSAAADGLTDTAVNSATTRSLPVSAAAPPQVSAPRASVLEKPTFAKISAEYIKMRGAADGDDHKDIQYLRLRRQTFLELIEDRPVDQYTGKDLQDYLNAMQFWPANVTKRAEVKGFSVRDMLSLNQDRHLAPLAQKTMQDGYLANIKTMIRSGMTTYGYQDPFAGVRLHWPKGFAPSVPREGIDDEVLNKTFRLGIDSGLLDSALLPLLAELTSRRLGLLCFLQGKDFRRKHGVWIAQTAGIVFEQGVWKRVPIKTAESTTFFVLHEKLSEIGFVDWAASQPGYVFEAVHEYKDPAKSTSKNLNRLLRNAGARGGVEVLHSLRGDGIDEMRAQDIDGRARRLQAGHTLGDEHDQYGFRALSASACHQLATAKLKRQIDWSIFRDIDFEKLATARRS